MNPKQLTVIYKTLDSFVECYQYSINEKERENTDKAVLDFLRLTRQPMLYEYYFNLTKQYRPDYGGTQNDL